jgi:hypothetical protein
MSKFGGRIRSGPANQNYLRACRGVLQNRVLIGRRRNQIDEPVKLNVARTIILLVPGERIELPTNGLQNRCSTAELTRQINDLGFRRHF